MSSKPILRGAIVGYGHVAAEGHASSWTARDGVELVAVADPDPARRERFVRSRPAARAYADAETLLANETLDFVDICTPPSSHGGLIELALEAGLHVLCEKPLTTSAADAMRIHSAARMSGRVVHSVHNWLAAPLCRSISSLIADGRVGTVRSVSWTTLRTGPSATVGGEGASNWRLDPLVAGGGILIDHGWHAAYCVALWAGGAPTKISARLETRRFRALGVEDTATVDLDFGAARGRIFLTWAADERANTIAVHGDEGSIEVMGADIVVRARGEEQRWTCPPALSDGSHHPEWFGTVAGEFVEAVRGMRPSNLTEAVMCARLMDGAKASSEAGGAWRQIIGP